MMKTVCFDVSSGDEVEISDDQRIMDEMIQREREHMVRTEQRLRRSQTEENTLINSDDKLFDPNYWFQGFSPQAMSSQAPKPAPQKNLSDSRAATVSKKNDGTSTNFMATREPNNDFGTIEEKSVMPQFLRQIDTTI